MVVAFPANRNKRYHWWDMDDLNRTLSAIFSPQCRNVDTRHWGSWSRKDFSHYSINIQALFSATFPLPRITEAHFLKPHAVLVVRTPDMAMTAHNNLGVEPPMPVFCFLCTAPDTETRD